MSKTSKHSSDESGCGCIIVLLLIFAFAYLWFPRHESAEAICAKQGPGYETPFCKALADKYRGKP